MNHLERAVSLAPCDICSLHCMLLRPRLGGRDRLLFVRFPVLSHIIRKWVVRIRCRQQRLNGEEDGADLQRGTPLVLENVQADAPELVDVGVVDFRQKAHFGRRHRIVLAQKQLQFEDAACRRRQPRDVATRLHSPS